MNINNDESKLNEHTNSETQTEGENVKVETVEQEQAQKSADSKDYKKEYDQLYDRYLRLAADFDNYKKRTAKEKSDITAYGNEELIKAVLDVVDNLERALEHAQRNEDTESLIEGVKLVYNQLLSCLQRFGLQRIEADEGTEFDPRFHQAFERVETEDVSPGIILTEVVKGYKLKERLLRPAIVSVSAGISNKPENDESDIEQNVVEINDDSEDNEIGTIDLTDEDTTN